MVTLNLETKSETQQRLKTFLEQNASEILTDKINNGVYIEKDEKRLLNKKDLSGFVKYATQQAKQQAAKDETGAFVDDDTVFGWLIHYFEENDIIGTLYNENGAEYQPAKPKTATATSATYTPPKPTPKPQLNIFDMLTGETTENNDNSPQTEVIADTAKPTEKAISPVISANKPNKQPFAFYQTYLKLIDRYEGFLILLRLGDFYEAFNDHATTLANELNLTLTGRDCGLDERVPIVGIPEHAVYDYINKIVEHGYKVILAEDLDNVLEFKNIDECEEPEELSEEEMRKFDSYVDEDTDELPTVSKITEGVELEDDDDCTELLNAESAKAFDSETVCIISDLLDGQITLA